MNPTTNSKREPTGPRIQKIAMSERFEVCSESQRSKTLRGCVHVKYVTCFCMACKFLRNPEFWNRWFSLWTAVFIFVKPSNFKAFKGIKNMGCCIYKQWSHHMFSEQHWGRRLVNVSPAVCSLFPCSARFSIPDAALLTWKLSQLLPLSFRTTFVEEIYSCPGNVLMFCDFTEVRKKAVYTFVMLWLSLCSSADLPDELPPGCCETSEILWCFWMFSCML